MEEHQDFMVQVGDRLTDKTGDHFYIARLGRSEVALVQLSGSAGWMPTKTVEVEDISKPFAISLLVEEDELEWWNNSTHQRHSKTSKRWTTVKKERVTLVQKDMIIMGVCKDDPTTVDYFIVTETNQSVKGGSAGRMVRVKDNLAQWFDDQFSSKLEHAPGYHTMFSCYDFEIMGGLNVEDIKAVLDR
jgi:hypothetical protein